MTSSLFIRSIRDFEVVPEIFSVWFLFYTSSYCLYEWLWMNGVSPVRAEIDDQSFIWYYRIDAPQYVSLIKKLDDYVTSKR